MEALYYLCPKLLSVDELRPVKKRFNKGHSLFTYRYLYFFL